MRIQHNIMAMNAYRNYTTNTSALSKNLEKLSSGYRINRAGDDAAGLAISEKMRAQITALGTASKNVKDGISLVKTAEGATQEVHDMLNRMVDLATQSANGTYQDKVDREAIEQEFNALKTEIDRIADASNFNGIKLLDGSMNGVGKMEFTGIQATPFEDGAFAAGTASKGEYHYDLSDLKLNMAAGQNIDSTTAAFEISIGGMTVGSLQLKVARTAGDGAATLTAGDFSFVAASTSVAISGLDFDIGFSEGKITLTGTGKAGADPAAADVTNFNGVDLSLKLITKHASVTDTNQGYDFKAHVDSAVAAAGDRKLAGADFALTDGDIKDGTVLKIGEQTYSFKVGKDGKGGEGTVIDLSAFKEGDTGIARKAIELLSQQDNKHFHIISNNDGQSFGLREKDGALKSYDDWDLDGTAAAKDATWTYKTGDNKGQSLVQIGQMSAPAEGAKSLTLQIGEDSEKYNQLTLDIQDLHSAALGLDKLTLGNQEDAQKAVSKIKDAINVVSTVRSGLGATQNRLEHTANNLSVMKENIQDAESTIRDTDVAEEMMAYTKNNILVQSAQAMLAQANQVPQGVLQLLG